MILLALKIALIIAVSGQLVFAADYTRLTRGACWRDPIGITLIAEAVFVAGELVPLLLATFWHLSTLGNEIGTWVLIGFFFVSGIVTYWRTAVFELEHRRQKKDT